MEQPVSSSNRDLDSGQRLRLEARVDILLRRQTLKSEVLVEWRPHFPTDLRDRAGSWAAGRGSVVGAAAIAIAWYEHQQQRKAASRASHQRRWFRNSLFNAA
jgi:hypothetical protein